MGTSSRYEFYAHFTEEEPGGRERLGNLIKFMQLVSPRLGGQPCWSAQDAGFSGPQPGKSGAS